MDAMETSVLVALISAAATIIAALITSRASSGRKSQGVGMPPDPMTIYPHQLSYPPSSRSIQPLMSVLLIIYLGVLVYCFATRNIPVVQLERLVSSPEAALEPAIGLIVFSVVFGLVSGLVGAILFFVVGGSTRSVLQSITLSTMLGAIGILIYITYSRDILLYGPISTSRLGVVASPSDILLGIAASSIFSFIALWLLEKAGA